VLQNTIEQYIGWCKYLHWDGTTPTFNCDEIILPYWENFLRPIDLVPTSLTFGMHFLPIPYSTSANMDLYCPQVKNACSFWHFPTNNPDLSVNGLNSPQYIPEHSVTEIWGPFAYANILGSPLGTARLTFAEDCASSVAAPVPAPQPAYTIVSKPIGIHRMIAIESQPVTGTQLHCDNNLQQAVEVTLQCTLDNMKKIDCTDSSAVDWVFKVQHEPFPAVICPAPDPSEILADGPDFAMHPGFLALHIYTQTASLFLEGEIITDGVGTAIVQYDQDYYLGADHSLIVQPLTGSFLAGIWADGVAIVGATSLTAANIAGPDLASGSPYLLTQLRIDKTNPLYPMGAFFIGERVFSVNYTAGVPAGQAITIGAPSVPAPAGCFTIGMRVDNSPSVLPASGIVTAITGTGCLAGDVITVSPPVGGFLVGDVINGTGFTTAPCTAVAGVVPVPAWGTVEYVNSGSVPAVYVSGLDYSPGSPTFGVPYNILGNVQLIVGEWSGASALLTWLGGPGYYAEKMWIVKMGTAPTTPFKFWDAVTGTSSGATGRVAYITSGAVVLTGVVGAFQAGETMCLGLNCATLSTASRFNGIGLAVCNHNEGPLGPLGASYLVGGPGATACVLGAFRPAGSYTLAPFTGACIETNHNLRPEDPVYFRDPLNPCNVKALLDVQIWP